MVRVAEAAGASGVVVAGASADPFGWKSLRGSMGSALRVPLALRPRVADALAEAKAAGCRVLAAVPRGGTPLSQTNMRGATAILIGGEGPGLPSHVLDAVDERISIPMREPVDSLNVAVATALIAFEASRQRAAGP
jgi:TrmH family RNA methyltransferase